MAGFMEEVAFNKDSKEAGHELSECLGKGEASSGTYLGLSKARN